jgi:hypothetical protein
MKALIGYADALNHIGQPERAVELLTLAANRPALLADVAPFVDEYLSETALPPDVLEAAQARGKTLDFEATGWGILNEA